jgi:hypothetical protein
MRAGGSDFAHGEVWQGAADRKPSGQTSGTGGHDPNQKLLAEMLRQQRAPQMVHGCHAAALATDH